MARWRLRELRQLREVVEVPIAGEKVNSVLHDQGRNPQVVSRDRGSLAPELHEQSSVMVARVFIRDQHFHSRLDQKSRQVTLVVRGAATMEKSGSEFGEHDQRQQDLLGASDDPDR